jgi:acyl-CoA thioester hydrolase
MTDAGNHIHPAADRPEEYPSLYPIQTRFDDLDPLGHINNIAFAVFAESARIEWERVHIKPLMAPGLDLVMAHLELDFLHELLWPGNVDIGTRLIRVGTSSLAFRQALFQNGRCCALVHPVLVQFDLAIRHATPFTPEARQHFATLVEAR